MLKSVIRQLYCVWRKITTVVKFLNNFWMFEICKYVLHVCKLKWNEVWNSCGIEDCNNTELQHWEKNSSNVITLQHKMHTIFLPLHRSTTVHFERCYLYCILHKICDRAQSWLQRNSKRDCNVYSLLRMLVWVCNVFRDRGREHYRRLHAVTMWHRTL